MVLRIFARLQVLRMQLRDRVRQVFADESGATVAEYALVLVLVTLTVVTVLGDLGKALKDKLVSIASQITAANPGQ